MVSTFLRYTQLLTSMWQLLIFLVIVDLIGSCRRSARSMKHPAWLYSKLSIIQNHPLGKSNLIQPRTDIFGQERNLDSLRGIRFRHLLELEPVHGYSASGRREMLVKTLLPGPKVT